VAAITCNIAKNSSIVAASSQRPPSGEIASSIFSLFRFFNTILSGISFLLYRFHNIASSSEAFFLFALGTIRTRSMRLLGDVRGQHEEDDCLPASLVADKEIERFGEAVD
jgi:hypothetical protein